MQTRKNRNRESSHERINPSFLTLEAQPATPDKASSSKYLSSSQVFKLSLGNDAPGRALLRLRAEPGLPVTGIAFWAPWPQFSGGQ